MHIGTVDTLRTDKFYEEFDSQFGLVYADALYIFLKELKDYKEKKERPQNSNE